MMIIQGHCCQQTPTGELHDKKIDDVVTKSQMCDLHEEGEFCSP